MIAIVLQFWAGDYREAMALAKFIADIEPRRRDDVRFRLVARYDCEHADMTTLQHVGIKFDVSWAKTSTFEWDGWPAGPNGMAKEVLHSAPTWLHDNGWDCDGILMLEPDCAPLSPDWLDKLIAEWAVARAAGKVVMGSWRNSGGAFGHINGNCIVGAEVARGLSRYIHQGLAWDCELAPYLRDKWHITSLIRNDFGSRGATEEVLMTPEVIGGVRPVLIHGFKDSSAMDIARRRCFQEVA